MHETWILPKYGVMNSLDSMRTRGRGRVQFADRADGLALDDYLCDKVGHQVSRIRLHSYTSAYPTCLTIMQEIRQYEVCDYAKQGFSLSISREPC